MKFTEKLFGTHSERELKRIYPIVDKIEALRPTMQALTDEELRAKTKEYNCLLYTSPSPRDRTRSRMPSSA